MKPNDTNPRRHRPAFDPGRCLVMIAAWPDGRVMPDILSWLFKHGFRGENIAVYNVRKVVRAYNRAVRDIALPSRFDWFVFFDNDIKPGAAADPFLSADADVAACQYPTANESSWGEPTMFHTGLWRCHRRVLETIKPPWFLEEFSPDGCELVRCVCGYFRDKVVGAGFTIRRAGWANHEPAGRGCRPHLTRRSP